MLFDSALPFGSLTDRAHFLRVSMLAVVAGSACHTPETPRIDGVAGAPANPATPWTVPVSARTPPPPPGVPVAPAASAALAADSATTAVVQFSLADVVDLALRSNPATRESWANAQTAADQYGSARGALFPTINGSVNLAGASTGSAFGGGGGGGNSVVVDTSAGSTRAVGAVGGLTRAQITPAISLSYLVLDAGGRKAAIEAAKQNAIAMNLAHNTAINDLVLAVESALFTYLANMALRDAEITAVKEAQTDTAAAEARLRVGVGTLQDVLQARTELSQARFQLVTLQGTLITSRATLAAAMGLPANARFEIPTIAATDSVAKIAASVDTLINRAITLRPDLAQARAAAAQLGAQIRVAQSEYRPSLTLSTIQSYTQSVEGSAAANGLNASLVFGLQVPIFNGYSSGYDVRAARAQYQAGLARVASTQQQIAVQVFTSYTTLQTARERLAAAAELLASAGQSADVAAGRYHEGVGTILDILVAGEPPRLGAGLPGHRSPSSGRWPVAVGARTSARSTFGGGRSIPARRAAEESISARHRRLVAKWSAAAWRRRRGVMQAGADGAQDTADAGACHDHLTHRAPPGHRRGERRRRADADGVGDGAGERHAARLVLFAEGDYVTKGRASFGSTRVHFRRWRIKRGPRSQRIKRRRRQPRATTSGSSRSPTSVGCRGRVVRRPTADTQRRSPPPRPYKPIRRTSARLR